MRRFSELEDRRIQMMYSIVYDYEQRFTKYDLNYLKEDATEILTD